MEHMPRRRLRLGFILISSYRTWHIPHWSLFEQGINWLALHSYTACYHLIQSLSEAECLGLSSSLHMYQIHQLCFPEEEILFVPIHPVSISLCHSHMRGSNQRSECTQFLVIRSNSIRFMAGLSTCDHLVCGQLINCKFGNTVCIIKAHYKLGMSRSTLKDRYRV